MNQPSSVAFCISGVECGSCSVHVCQVFARCFSCGAVVPGRRRRVLHPGVVGAAVVRHLVLDHLDAQRVRPVHQLPQRGEVAEVLLDRVEVHRAVAVVVGDRLAVVRLALVQVVDVVVPGVEPDRGDPEVLQVRQAIDHPAQVAAVVVAALRRDRGGPSTRPGRRSPGRRSRSGRASAGRSRRPARSPGSDPRAGAARGSRAGSWPRPPAVRMPIVARAGRRLRVDRHVHEEVGPRLVHLHRARLEPRRGARHLGARRGSGPARAAAPG